MSITVKWTEAEVKFLVASVKSGNRPSEIANFLKRSEKSVRCKISVLGLQPRKKKNDKIKGFYLTDVLCPYFYSFYRGRSIKCEGVGRPGSYIRCGFEFSDEWTNHVTLYCNCDWKKCPIARMLIDKSENK